MATASSERLTAVHADVIWKALGKLRVPPEDRREVSQNVLIALWKHWHKYDPSRPFEPWAFVLCRTAARLYRKRKFHRDQRHALVKDPVALPSAEPDPEQCATARDRLRLVHGMLAELPRAHAEAVLRHDGCGIPVETIAQEENVSVSTVKSWLARGRVGLMAARHRFETRLRRQGQTWAVLPPLLLARQAAERARNGPATMPARQPAASADGSRFPRGGRASRVHRAIGQVPGVLAGAALVLGLGLFQPDFAAPRLLPPSDAGRCAPATTGAVAEALPSSPRAIPVDDAASPVARPRSATVVAPRVALEGLTAEFSPAQVRAQYVAARARLNKDDALGALRMLDSLDRRDRRGLLARERGLLRMQVLDRLRRSSAGT